MRDILTKQEEKKKTGSLILPTQSGD
jgi:hypothetical protein